VTELLLIAVVVFAAGFCVGRVWVSRDAMLDWQEGYMDCMRDWDDWERARTRGVTHQQGAATDD